MKFSTASFLSFGAFAALSLFASSAEAKISHISVPEQAIPGQNITLTLTSQSYIQNWDDFGAILGLVRQGNECETCLGQEVGYINLYKNDTLGNSTHDVTLPETDAGQYTFVVAIPYLVGASGVTGINYFNQSITLTSSAKMRV
ncbi:hypothetical protein I317_06312 [Kwoniella heveanensis CBS 569]|uniref:Uncharacterized protein n=1 Tax=Kwoniella heveanensis BCC8398 TaxID=1296120 RepID=A0A1B9GWI1_9TREE|nr:hypothetical protein I316_02936 [Kwoniella heveanensis BCC8398]OCF39875.1 hypothetical protein I317_06312 [Kwoniella heveanensis CBS 569]